MRYAERPYALRPIQITQLEVNSTATPLIERSHLVIIKSAIEDRLKLLVVTTQGLLLGIRVGICLCSRDRYLA